MSTATASLDGGTLPDLRAGGQLAAMLDAVLIAPAGARDLPCRIHDPDLWFADSPAELERAKRLCADCPLRAECLAGALSRQEPWGVWGGEILERGEVVARKRPRGRPRKAAVERECAEQTGHAGSVNVTSAQVNECVGVVRASVKKEHAA